MGGGDDVWTAGCAVGGATGVGGGGVVGDGGDDRPNQIVRNTEWKNGMFRRFQTLNVRVRDVLRNAANPPPNSPLDATGATTMCVAYHVKGMCYERCSRSIDHAAHTDAQDAPLVTWCERHYVES